MREHRWIVLAVAALLASCAGEPGGSSGSSGETDAGRRDIATDTDLASCGRGIPNNACGGCADLGVGIGTSCDMDGSAPEGFCAIAVWQCDPADPDVVICDWIRPAAEICDGLDNDCDTLVDEDFDLANNPENCGRCGVVCVTPNAVPGCVDGVCIVDHCQPGHANEDGLSSNGCEADCYPETAIDDCDGRDNDCDGWVDEDYVPEPCGVGVCSTTSFCVDGEEIACTPNPPLAEVEVACDALDDDCDGEIDEDLATPCSNDCGDGEMVCRSGEFPACSAMTPEGEVCVDIQFFCQTIPLTLELPLPTPEDELGVDVVFVFDRSGSFGDDLLTFSNKATELTNALSTEIADLAVGLSSFVDAPCSGFGGGSDFGFEMNLALTTTHGQLGEVLDTLSTLSGADVAESQLEAMYQALTGEGLEVSPAFPSCLGVADIPPSDQGWREHKLSFMFVSTDAEFHRPTDFGYPYPHDADDVIAAAADRGTGIFFLQAGGTTDVNATRIASETGGAVFTLSSDSREIVDTVTDAIFEALSNSEVELRAESDVLHFVTDVFPERLSGVDLLTNDSLTVSVTLLSTVNATGEEQTYAFDLVFVVNGAEIARRPVTVTIPAQDPKDCNNRPPIIRALNVPDIIRAGATVVFGVEIEELDSEPVIYRWEASEGNLAQADSSDATFGAPGAPGIVDVSVTVTDPDGNSDSAQQSVLIASGGCSQNARFLDLGLTSGRMVLDGQLNQNVATGSCGGGGAEGFVVLRVHRAGRYRLSAEGDEAFILHLRAANCTTELACAAGGDLEVQLQQSHYHLFVDTPHSLNAGFHLFAEPLD